MKIQIIGCGGVGSNAAYLLTKVEGIDQFVLCDHDLVEPKNIMRQFFFSNQTGMNKAEALKHNLLLINPDLRVEVIPLKIEEELDLKFFDRDAVTILSTDNVKSKVLCGKYFRNFILTNCEHDFAELKTALDKEELSAWDMGGGYNSTQTFMSNMAAALKIYEYVSDAVTNGIPGYISHWIPTNTTLLYPFLENKHKTSMETGAPKITLARAPPVVTATTSTGR